MFASRLPLAERYAELLASAGVERGLIGPREVPRLWHRHLLNCAAVSSVLPTDVTVADLGSGAGLPGLVLAIRRPDLGVTLVEPMQRRTAFLEEVARDLGLDNVAVVRGRAEELQGQVTAQVVTSRAVAPLQRLLQWSVPLTANDGVIIAIKGRAAREEVAALPVPARVRAAFEVLELDVAGESVQADEKVLPTTVVRVESAAVRDIAWHRSGGGEQRRRPRSNQPRRR